MSALSWTDAALVGLAQAAAILPGISRSGATIAAGLGRGLERVAAARYSLLLSVPIVLGAGLVKIVDLAESGGLSAAAPALLVGFVASLGVGIIAIRFLMRHLQGGRLYPFAVYCAAVGMGCLVLVAVRGA
jgi:undecaprenyl-diphosphatase